MTHSNHRRGDRESLMEDWVVFSAPGTELVDIDYKHKEFIDILIRNDPVCCTTNIGIEGESQRLRYVKGWNNVNDSGVHKSSTLKEIMNAKHIRKGSAVYDNKEAVQQVVKNLVEADLGFSVVVSGIFEEVYDICEKVGIEAHTVNMSGETLGKMSLMPEPEVLEITTMCGHHFVATNLVRHLLEQVKQDRITPEEAAVEMAKQCTCNFFNASRAAKLVEEFIRK
jgi:hypothetical protein